MIKLVGGVILMAWVFAFIGETWAFETSDALKKQFFTEPIPKRLCSGGNEETFQELPVDDLGPFSQAKIKILGRPTEGNIYSGSSSDYNRWFNKVWVKVVEVLEGDVPRYRFHLYFSTHDSRSGVGRFPKDAVGKSFYILGYGSNRKETEQRTMKGKLFVYPVSLGTLKKTARGTCLKKDKQ